MTSENLIDYVRIALYVALAVIVFFLFQAWTKDHPPVVAPETAQTTTLPADRYVPEITNTGAPSAASVKTMPAPDANTRPLAPPTPTGQLVTVSTDVLEVAIDTHGGDIISTKLLKYPESLHSKQPFILLNDDPKTRYIAESGLLGKNGPDTAKAKALYTVDKTQYSLENNAQNENVVLTWKNADGLVVKKTFTFSRGSYEILVKYDIANQGTQPWEGNLYSQLMRTNVEPVSNGGGLVNLTTYFGAAISTQDKPFEKITFKNMQKENLQKTTTNGWAAMIQHYFISAWITPKEMTSTYYSRVTPSGLYAIGMIAQPITIAPGAQQTISTKLYTGPTIKSELEKVAPNLKLTIDYGWFWFISDIIFWMMQKIYSFVGNWGWSIVLVTVIIKLLFYQLSAKSYRSMSAMKKLQPKIEALKERYADDKQKMTQATLELYKQEKVNPMSGCLPILVQIPVFIALYWVLVESVQLRQAPFIFWIHDLSQHDPYYILPILMGASMFLQQWLNPPPPDPMQAKVMMAMPIVFTFLFANFPAGLMLYWFVNNTLSFLQQYYIMRGMNNVSNVKAKA